MTELGDHFADFLHLVTRFFLTVPPFTRSTETQLTPADTLYSDPRKFGLVSSLRPPSPWPTSTSSRRLSLSFRSSLLYRSRRKSMLALLSVLLAASQLTTALPQATTPALTASFPLPTAPLPGLPPNGIRVNGISIGVLPDWSHESPRDVNAALGELQSTAKDASNELTLGSSQALECPSSGTT